MPGSAAKLLDLLACRRTSAASPHVGDAARAGRRERRCRRRRRSFRAMSSRPSRLSDAGRQPLPSRLSRLRRGARRGRRARARGRRRADGHDLDAGEALRQRAGDRRGVSDDVYCSVGTHPHNAGEEPDVTADELVRLAGASEGRGDRRGRARLSLRQVAARRAGAGLSHPYRGRAAKPACRW